MSRIFSLMARKPKPSGRRKRKGRPQSALKRLPGQRQARSHILITCEGAKTEPNYFEALRRKLRLTSVEVEIAGKSHASDPIRVVGFAIQQKTKRVKEAKRSDFLAEYDEVWSVIDVENPANNTLFDKAVQQAKRENIQLAVSNPAFEYWYLLHYKETARVFRDGQELKQALRDYEADYRARKDMFTKLYHKTDLAIERAKRILANHLDQSPYPNPSTYVFKLVERLKNLAAN